MYINNLVEMHSHITPAVDDGAKDIETSLKMIAKLQAQGAKKIVLTPHYYSDTISLDDFLRRRDKAINALLSALPPGSPTLIPAAEVYITKYLFNYDSLDELRIANSDYVLIEHPFSASFNEDDYNRLMNLYCDYGVKPVLAHIERYRALMEGKHTLDQYIEIGCLTQVNVNSFDDAPRSIRKKLFKLLDEGKIHLLGSDCHNLDTRPPEYRKGVNAIIKKSSQDAINILMNNANQLVK
jgi:protein-tyrosine phosphatase